VSCHSYDGDDDDDDTRKPVIKPSIGLYTLFPCKL